MRFGVGANIGEAGGIGHAGGLAGFRVGPALALLEFDGVIVEELIDGHGGEHQCGRMVKPTFRRCTCRGGACPAL